MNNIEPKIVRFADTPEPKPFDCSQALKVDELSWELILEEEPEIGRIFDELRRIKPKHKRWKRHPKMRLAKLVGWRARNPRLRSQEAYKMVMGRMWDLLL